jgi:hypothetical protein
MPPSSIKEPRVKYYGLFWISRSTYLAIQIPVLILIVAVMAFGALGMIQAGQPLPQVIPPQGPMPDGWLWTQCVIGLFWIGLLTLALEGVETIVMLKKFAREEVAERARQSSLEANGTAPRTGRSEPSDRLQARDGLRTDPPVNP